MVWEDFLSRLAEEKYDAYIYRATGSWWDMDEFVVHINQLYDILKKATPQNK